MPYLQAKQRLEGAGLQPPLLVKPLWTDGREGSHGLAVLHDIMSLEKLVVGRSQDLQPPLVVQQFVEHGGVLYKVRALGQRGARAWACVRACVRASMVQAAAL